MPTYPKGTRQWAEQRLKEITFDPVTQEAKFLETQDEWSRLTEALEKGLPEGTPTYTKEELEAAGQGVLL